MGNAEWDGVTKAATLTPAAAALRQRLADRARAYDWGGVLAILAQEPGLINATRPDGRSRYAVLHQAAHGGAPTAVVENLIVLGAWRTLREARGERPEALAARQGHTHLLALLRPVLQRSIAEEVLAALQHHFHAVIMERAAALVEEHALRLPELAVLQELAIPHLWFPVPGMYGGFNCRLETLEQQAVLVVESWSRVVEGSDQVHLVSPHGYLLIAEGRI